MIDKTDFKHRKKAPKCLVLTSKQIEVSEDEENGQREILAQGFPTQL